MRRTIFVGDVHGCFDELMDLLGTLKYNAGQDKLYFVGDVINRGPYSAKVLNFILKTPLTRSVMGNHEWHFLKAIETGDIKQSMARVFLQLSPNIARYHDLLSSMPFWIKKKHFRLFHAGLLPGVRLREMPKEKLLQLRELDDGRPWDEVVETDRYAIFGHWAMRGLVRHGYFRGLDTGCVYGGRLSAVVLPEDLVVSVPARKVYFDPETHCEKW